MDSEDLFPWEHPYLTAANIRRFREYSLAVRDIALRRRRATPRELDIGFCINIAQNTYKWARMIQAAGTRATLYLHGWDQRALSCPEWEEFDGEWPDVMDGPGFRAAFPKLRAAVPCTTYELHDFGPYYNAWQSWKRGDRKPLLALQALNPNLHFDSVLAYDGLYAYLLPWANELSRHDVTCSAYFPIPAYLSGKPYCAFAIGADLQTECGLANSTGQLQAMAFHGARFLWLSNPHSLGHCRRLGFKNALYVPYPMDDSRYCPGEPQARKEWEQRFGPGFYVLSTARLDQAVKGNTGLFDDLALLTLRLPSVRFVFLSWGADAGALAQRIERSGLQKHFIMLSPVGKARLIDYYRSCDCVLDQLVYGYYGATGLEALSVGKPVVMRILTEHYDPLYGGDVAPVLNCPTHDAVPKAIESLARNAEYRAGIGAESRAWLVRNHGERVTIPLMLAILQFTMERGLLPEELRSPLWDEESLEETHYHQSRSQPAGQDKKRRH
jgi:glycosyltransferase involved in cell wall biosynthesis